MDVHARTITVKGIDGSTAATAAKRFDDVPAPSEIASWMQGEFTAPGMPSTKAAAPASISAGSRGRSASIAT